ncbi:P-loop containing nucleoside triphosphate hydrolase protein [Clohesyomyces aquaticus]|uniref:p-loop containing nucleoside triphosphate hydrolase protein n=1 Tax=Clohesyomyces aquaticus TaxID=1231657 RepID=A0A1Y1Y8F3_9PLEO|nr:P-loop containing nucleoside triphosphate hydrolase protein [Clohesyomyces aquaticus]
MASPAERNVVVFGESGVGKTCFTDMFMREKPFALYDPTLGDTEAKAFDVDRKTWRLTLIDLNATQLRLEQEERGFVSAIYFKMLWSADGVVLLYDVTSKASYEHIVNEGYMTVLKRRRQTRGGKAFPTGMQRFGCVLVGNKIDLAEEKREVDRELAQEWADSMGIEFFELSALDNTAVNEAMSALVRSMVRAEARDNEDLGESPDKAKENSKKFGFELPFRHGSSKMSP